MTDATTTAQTTRDRKEFTHDEVFGALCTWEWMLENKETHAQLHEQFEQHGTNEMRCMAIHAGVLVNEIYNYLPVLEYEYNGSFDWEFTPLVLARLDWQAIAADHVKVDRPYEPNLHEVLVPMITADMAANVNPDDRSFHKITKRDAWDDLARQAGDKYWGYGDLASDHHEHTDAAFEAGQAPEEFIKDLGHKYGLTPQY